jgi:DnaK suppressor protein
MAKTKDKNKDKKSKSSAKPIKKTVKPAPKPAKKVVAKAKPAKKVNKPAPTPAKKVVSKAAKPATKKPIKKVIKQKPAPKKVVAKPVKKTAPTPAKPVAKEIAKVKKTAGKPIDAVVKKDKNKKPLKTSSKKKSIKDDDEEDDDIPAEKEEEDDDVEVKDDYEKNDDDDAAIVDGGLDEAGLIDLEGGPPEIDEDDDEIPEKRGRGRRKKNEGKSSGGSMEAYIRNRPLQIDINKPLIKKGNIPIPKPFINTDDKRTRYSDKELAEFKELILEKLKEAQTDYDLLKQTLSNEDNHGTDDTSPSFKLLEDGSDVMSKEETAQLASRQEKYIVNLKNALVRIENKAYGICRVTGKLIPKERLRSVPHATLGIDAKLGQSK